MDIGPNLFINYGMTEAMRTSFLNCKKFNQNLNNWDISKVEDFKNALDSFAVGDKIAVFGTREGSNFFVAVTVE